MATNNSIDYALRVVESIAFSIHGILGLTEPFTGCLRSAFRDNGAMPSWFWPVAGAILLVVARANFSSNDTVVLVTQAYIASFHMGAVMYHLRLQHHPAAGTAPGVFVVIAFFVVVLRANFLVAFVGIFVCAAIAAILSRILITPPSNIESNQRDDYVAIS